jgi:hypothetical protein
MIFRNAARAVATGAAVVCVGALSTVAFSGVAGALTSGGSVTNAIIATNPDPTSGNSITPGTPFQSGQTVEVTVPANTVFNPATNVVIGECAAPNGVIPTLTSACDVSTSLGASIFPASDGSIDDTSVVIYALPDVPSLGESPTGTPKCGNTLATECVLYIGNNITDFTAAHVWSEPFLVSAVAGDNPTNPGDGTPEVPLAIGLPIAAVGIFGGVMYRRRRRSNAAA